MTIITTYGVELSGKEALSYIIEICNNTIELYISKLNNDYDYDANFDYAQNLCMFTALGKYAEEENIDDLIKIILENHEYYDEDFILVG